MAVEEGDDSHSDKMSNDLDLDILQPPEVVHSHKAVELALVHNEGEVHMLVDGTSLVMIMEIVCQFHKSSARPPHEATAFPDSVEPSSITPSSVATHAKKSRDNTH